MLFSIAPGRVNSLVVKASSVSLNVSWEVPDTRGNCQVSEYDVMYQLTHLDRCELKTEPTHIISTTFIQVNIPGLEAYSSYNISVRAKTGMVLGEFVNDSAETQESGKKI